MWLRRMFRFFLYAFVEGEKGMFVSLMGEIFAVVY